MCYNARLPQACIGRLVIVLTSQQTEYADRISKAAAFLKWVCTITSQKLLLPPVREGAQTAQQRCRTTMYDFRCIPLDPRQGCP